MGRRFNCYPYFQKKFCKVATTKHENVYCIPPLYSFQVFLVFLFPKKSGMFITNTFVGTLNIPYSYTLECVRSNGGDVYSVGYTYETVFISLMEDLSKGYLLASIRKLEQ